jgi:hypothetical protein
MRKSLGPTPFEIIQESLQSFERGMVGHLSRARLFLIRCNLARAASTCRGAIRNIVSV